MAVPTVSIAGSIIDPEGVGLVKGTIVCKLSQPGSALDGAASVRVTGEGTGTIANGVLTGLSLVPNDAITPSGTYYIVVIEGRLENGRTYRGAEKWQLASTPSPIDVGAVPRLDVVPGLGVGLVSVVGDGPVHRGLPASSNHVIHSWEVANAAARLALVPGASDLGRVARQADDGSLWVCTSYAPVTWAPIGPDLGPALVTPTGATTARSLRDRAADVVWVTDYGAKCDGVTDDTSSVMLAVAAAMTSGKELRFPAGTCRIDGQIVLPNDGATPPKQRPLRIVGSGSTMSGRGAASGNGGTVLDMRYSGSYGKVLTTGLGLLEITGVTFTDGSGGSLPWVYTTNTTLHIWGASFIGTKLGALCDQDAIILGGTVGVEGQGDPTHGFQGYGTVIRDNYFNRVRRAVYGRTFANATVIRDNTIWSSAGSNLAGGAAIEFDDVSGAQSTTGNVIAGNLIEVTNYPYGIKLGRASQNALLGNNCYDPGGSTLACVRFESSATFNHLVDGFAPGTLSRVSDASTGSTNTHVAFDQGAGSRFASQGAFVFRAEGDGVVQESGTGAVPFAHFRNLSSGDEVYSRLGGVAGSPGILFFGLPSGGSAQQLAYFKMYSATQVGLQVNGSGGGYIETPDGDMRLRAKTGSVVWLGSFAGTSAYVDEANKRIVLNSAAYEIRFGSVSGPLMRAGAGTPEGVVTAPVGSLYLRTDGGAGTSHYVKESGTGATGWVAK